MSVDALYSGDMLNQHITIEKSHFSLERQRQPKSDFSLFEYSSFYLVSFHLCKVNFILQNHYFKIPLFPGFFVMFCGK